MLSPGTSAAFEVVTNPSGGRDYHHLRMRLALADFIETDELAARDLAYTFGDGGMFEVYLRSPLGPVAAPACPAVIVRMPWTDSADPEEKAKIADKKALFDEIEAVRSGRRESVDVVLELDPYLEKKNGGYELTECNAFFRQVDGAYVSNVEAAPR